MPLINASTAVYSVADSSLIKGTASDINGYFLIANLAAGSYLLKISYTGFLTHSQTLILEKDVQLGKIHLDNSASILSEFEIKDIVTPVEILGDTTQFNSAAYKTNPDATTEDLLKKLPGLEVKDGKVSAQGEAVTRVLIDGKEFFGDDPSIAIKNIPAHMIDKVQVYDQQSEQAEFTGFDDGDTEKTINVITKTGVKNGSFGKVYAGYGTDERYISGASLNYFNDERRISLLGLSNNINNQNFSSEDISEISRSSGGRRGGNFVGSPGGITKTNSAGINFSDKYNEKLELSSSYFYNNSASENESLSRRNYFIAGQQRFDEESANLTSNDNHRLNLKLKYKPDSSNTITIRPNFSFQSNNSLRNNSSQSFLNNEIINSSSSTEERNNAGYSFRNNLTWNHKFDKTGRTFSLRLSNSINDNSGISQLNAETYFFTADSVYRQNQKTESATNRQNHRLRFSYTEPLGKGLLQFSYDPSLQLNESDRYTYAYDTDYETYNALDTLLSNEYSNQSTIHRGGLQYMIKNGPKLNLSFGVDVQNSLLEGKQVFPAEFETRKSFFAILPEARLRWKLNENSNLRITYRTNTDVPSVTQLQNVVDNTNPLRLRSGNENLEQEFSQSLRANYSSGNMKKGTSFSASLSGSVTNNYIGQATYIAFSDTEINGIHLSPGTELSSPVNLENQYSSNLYLSYGLPVLLLKSKLNLTGTTRYSSTPGIINAEKNRSDAFNYGLGYTLASNISKRVDFTLGGNVSYTNSSNSLDNNGDYDYYSQSTSAAIYLQPWRGLVFTSNLNYISNYGLNEGYDQDIFLLNAGLGYKFLKDDAGEFKLTAFDLLNQNKSISRTTTDSYVQDSQTLVLKRYLMLTFTYNINKFK